MAYLIRLAKRTAKTDWKYFAAFLLIIMGLSTLLRPRCDKPVATPPDPLPQTHHNALLEAYLSGKLILTCKIITIAIIEGPKDAKTIKFITGSPKDAFNTLKNYLEKPQNTTDDEYCDVSCYPYWVVTFTDYAFNFMYFCILFTAVCSILFVLMYLLDVLGFYKLKLIKHTAHNGTKFIFSRIKFFLSPNQF